MKLIDKDALMNALGIAVECKDCSRKGSFGCKEDSAFVYACEAITDAPTIDVIKKLPPAQPEIIRCKDCKCWEFPGFCVDFMTQDENGFCSWAERREDGKH